MADDNSAMTKMANALEKVVELLQEASEDRKAVAASLDNRDWEAERKLSQQRMDFIRKETEEKYVQQLAFRAAVLEMMERQIELLRRIESKLADTSAPQS